MTFQAALHADGLVGANRAGAGFGIERELRSAEVQVDGTGAGLDLPSVNRLTGNADIAGAGLGFQAALHAAQTNRAGAGARRNASAIGKVNANVARAGLEIALAAQIIAVDGAGAGFQPDSAAHGDGLQVAGA